VVRDGTIRDRGVVRGRCFTNLDGYGSAKWPTEFIYPPIRGERVQAACGKSLAVVAISHCADADGPYLRIELHRGVGL
jgi:hypothetical protein